MTTRKTKKRNKSKKPNKVKSRKSNSSLMSADTKMEIFIVAIIGFSILWLLANFGLLGRGGNFLSSIFFAILGFQAYYFPIALLPVLALGIINKNKKKRYRNVMILVFFLSIATLLDVYYIVGKFDFIKAFFRGFNQRVGGGVLGYIFAYPLTKVFNSLGAFIISLILISLSFIVISEKYFMLKLGRKVKKGYETKLKERPKTPKKLKIQKPVEKEVVDTGLKTKPLQEANLDNFQTSLDAMLDKNEIKGSGAMELLPQEDVNKDKGQLDQKIPTEVTLTQEAIVEVAELEKDFDKTPKNTKVLSQSPPTIIKPITSSSLVKAATKYKSPPLSLLENVEAKKTDNNNYLRSLALKLKTTLDSFGVNATIEDISKGPSVTRFEIVPAVGVKVSKIVGLTDDIKLNLAAKDIRIEAPIPGKSAIGIEVPNQENSVVRIKELIESKSFKSAKSKLSFCVGLDIAGKPIISDIKTMPHVLVAGATGSGKSVFINSMIMSIIYKASPEEVKLIMIDPKVVELSVYNGIPHLLIPVVTDSMKATGALNWAVAEMEQRYKKFASVGVKDIFGYNKAILNSTEEGQVKLPQIVIIIDELADLMMVASAEVEASICRLAQLARACGIHLVIATQRPSVNVITGLIKANVPSRIAFAVSSGVDSRTILDMNGAEKLLGKGDMLFHPSSLPKPIRVQGAFVTENEVAKVVEYVSKIEIKDKYKESVEEQITEESSSSIARDRKDRDDYFEEALRIIATSEKASIGSLQRVLRIGFNRASRIMDQLFDAGAVGAEEGTKARKVLINEDGIEKILKGE